MTDPNKAAVAESNKERFARIVAKPQCDWTDDDTMFILNMAEERVMIEEHAQKQQVQIARSLLGTGYEIAVGKTVLVVTGDLSTAIRSVVAKLGEGNG